MDFPNSWTPHAQDGVSTMAASPIGRFWSSAFRLSTKAVLISLTRRQVERVKGIEPSYAAWEAAVLPLNYTRNRMGLSMVRH
jgi:hypothetical protein